MSKKKKSKAKGKRFAKGKTKYKRPVADAMGLRACPDCKTKHGNRSESGGVMDYCKKCQDKGMRAYWRKKKAEQRADNKILKAREKRKENRSKKSKSESKSKSVKSPALKAAAVSKPAA